MKHLFELFTRTKTNLLKCITNITRLQSKQDTNINTNNIKTSDKNVISRAYQNGLIYNAPHGRFLYSNVEGYKVFNNYECAEDSSLVILDEDIVTFSVN